MLTSSVLADRENNSIFAKPYELIYPDDSRMPNGCSFLVMQAAASIANIAATNRMFMQDNDHNNIDNTSL